MGYSRGFRWNDEEILKKLRKVIEELKIDTMPTKTQMNKVTGSYALSCAVSKHGGFKKFAEILGLEIKVSESKFGEEYEFLFMGHVREKTGLKVEKMPIKHPYDLLVGDSVKVDVKVSNITSTSVGYYSFNLEKNNPTCDVFACYCLNECKKIEKLYIIPSSVLKGKTQLSLGIKRSKYDNWLDRWEVLTRYVAYNNLILKM